ncbi:hypothetical protein [Paenibacillus sp. IHBB 10380]|uniref:hypothetical protein n=1 Tax=Paenibacillus sp. IHBB 10380 TaxID=1566358 RepID=UPI0005CFCF63|nr:hypothetical protein [Paenibacillus sp. IHBB 10380]AJS57801.1 hypothetical protein UB51_04070 [Paenibacillus sp. IHBB 10380]
MKKAIIFSLMLTFVLLAGCNNNSNNVLTNETATTPQVEGTQTPVEKSEPTVEPEKEKELTPGEKLSIEYVNTYLNGTDLDAKKKFVDEKVHPDTKQILEFTISMVTEKNKMFLNPRVVETTDYESAGKKGTLTLMRGDGDKEFIALIMDDKFGWGFISTETDEQMKQSFDEVRTKFKDK